MEHQTEPVEVEAEPIIIDTIGTEVLAPKYADAYLVNAESAKKLVEQYEGLTIDGIEDTEGAAKVSAGRKHLKRLRNATEKTRKEQTAPAIKHQKDVNAYARELVGAMEPTEKKLQAEEARIEALRMEAERLERERRQQLLDERMDQLNAVEAKFPIAAVRELDDEAFAALLGEATELFNVREAKKAEEVARLKAEQEAEQRKRDEEHAAAEAKRQEEAEKLLKEREKVLREREELAEERAAMARERAAAQAERDQLAEEKKQREHEEAEAARAAEPVPTPAESPAGRAARLEDAGLTEEDVADTMLPPDDLARVPPTDMDEFPVARCPQCGTPMHGGGYCYECRPMDEPETISAKEQQQAMRYLHSVCAIPLPRTTWDAQIQAAVVSFCRDVQHIAGVQ
jgi:chemotaxis protein histidine kinase CheA